MELTAIALDKPIEAIHPATGERIMIVGVELSRDPNPAMLIAFRHAAEGIFAERIEVAQHANPLNMKAA